MAMQAGLRSQNSSQLRLDWGAGGAEEVAAVMEADGVERESNVSQFIVITTGAWGFWNGLGDRCKPVFGSIGCREGCSFRCSCLRNCSIVTGIELFLFFSLIESSVSTNFCTRLICFRKTRTARHWNHERTAEDEPKVWFFFLPAISARIPRLHRRWWRPASPARSSETQWGCSRHCRRACRRSLRSPPAPTPVWWIGWVRKWGGTDRKWGKGLKDYFGGEAIDLEGNGGDGLGSLLHRVGLAHLEQALGAGRGVFFQHHRRLVLHAGDVEERRRRAQPVLVDKLHVERMEPCLRRQRFLQLACRLATRPSKTSRSSNEKKKKKTEMEVNPSAYRRRPGNWCRCRGGRRRAWPWRGCWGREGRRPQPPTQQQQRAASERPSRPAGPPTPPTATRLQQQTSPPLPSPAFLLLRSGEESSNLACDGGKSTPFRSNPAQDENFRAEMASPPRPRLRLPPCWSFVNGGRNKRRNKGMIRNWVKSSKTNKNSKPWRTKVKELVNEDEEKD